MEQKRSLKPGEKILFSVFGAFMALAIVGFIALEVMRSQSPNPMFVSLSTIDLSATGKQGSRVFRMSGCTACHRAMRSGTNMGLSLDGMGSHRSAEWIENFLKNPEDVNEAVTFDHGPGKEAGYVQNMPDEDLHSIAVFLSELKAEAGSSSARRPPPEDSPFIDKMVEMWAPESWKEEYQDIRDKPRPEIDQTEGVE